MQFLLLLSSITISTSKLWLAAICRLRVSIGLLEVDPRWYWNRSSIARALTCVKYTRLLGNRKLVELHTQKVGETSIFDKLSRSWIENEMKCLFMWSACGVARPPSCLVVNLELIGQANTSGALKFHNIRGCWELNLNFSRVRVWEIASAASIVCACFSAVYIKPGCN